MKPPRSDEAIGDAFVTPLSVHVTDVATTGHPTGELVHIIAEVLNAGSSTISGERYPASPAVDLPTTVSRTTRSA
jgi:hypothetical protein